MTDGLFLGEKWGKMTETDTVSTLYSTQRDHWGTRANGLQSDCRCMQVGT
jgi:hypothetical protein